MEAALINLDATAPITSFSIDKAIAAKKVIQ
jgi:hypothetical protein